MKLYHGSLEEIRNPRILLPTRTLDYGMGFYTTTSYEQAEQWVKRRQKRTASVGYVNVYQLDEQASQDLRVLWFDKPDEAWLDFVMSNRESLEFQHDYDLVYGPVANDRVYAAFALYEGGLLDKEGLIRELKTYELIDQLLFHTERSLRYLDFVTSQKIGL